jgi:gamma-glutamyltranspeptidase/glutathione hydrolase
MTRRPFLLLLLSLWLAPAFAADTAPLAPEGDTGRYTLSAAQGERAMVVTANPHATEAALAMLHAGGSAIDAAIAAQAVLGLVEPQSSGFGGGAFLVYHDGKRIRSFDGRETAPAAAREDRFLDRDGAPLPFHAVVASGRGIGVPGVLAALHAAHRQHGRLPFADTLAPAIRLAREGFAISPRLHELIARDPLLQRNAGTRAYFFAPDGTPLPAGHVLRNPAYAATLATLSRHGAQAFYSGPLARELMAALNAQGADFTARDWRRYRPRVGAALCAPYRRWEVCSAPPPSGGWTVLQTLRLLDGFTPSGSRALNLHRLLEAERLAFADRQRYSADPAFIPVPLDGLLSPGYIAARRLLIGEKSLQVAPAGIPPGLRKPWGDDGQLLENGTTHLSIVDARGHWLSMTSSIEDAFGSRVMAGGMLFNNQLTDFSFVPREQGRLLANRVAPGKRPRSAMAPVIVRDASGKPVLAAGSPGGSRIIGYVLHTLVASLDEGRAPAEVVALPLVLSRNGPTEIDSDFPPALKTELEAFGQVFKAGDLNSGIGLIRRHDGRLQGAADPRREGRAAGY